MQPVSTGMGGSGVGKHPFRIQLFLWNPCNSRLTTNDEGRGEFMAMETWNHSRYREAHSLTFSTFRWRVSRIYPCRLKTFGPTNVHRSLIIPDLLGIPVQCRKPTHSQVPLEEAASSLWVIPTLPRSILVWSHDYLSHRLLSQSRSQVFPSGL